MSEKPLKYGLIDKKLELRAEDMSYGDRKYPYTAVKHIGRYAKRTSVNFIPVADYLRIKIYLEGQPSPIVLRNTFGLLGSTSRLKKVYERLVEKTFAHRVKSYADQIESKGYFDYGNARFFPSGEVTVENGKVDLRKAKLWRQPFTLLIKEPTGFFKRKKKISMDIDQDVFLALLSELYGISFRK